MKKSLKLALGLAAAAAVTLTACSGGGGGGGNGSDGDRELEVFTWWTSGGEAVAADVLINSFTEATGVPVLNSLVAGQGGGNAAQVLQTRVQGGDAPDTWQAGPGGRINEYIDADVLADIADVYDEQGFRETMPEVIIESMTRDGKVYGVSPGVHRANVLWFNKQLLADAGIEPAEDYTTDAFLADMAKLESQGVTPLCLGGKDTFGTVQLYQNIMLGAVGDAEWYDIENGYMTGGPDWESPEARAGSQTFVDVLEYADSDAAALSWDQAAMRMAEGKCAFFSMGDWAYGEFLNAGYTDNEDFGYVAYPGTAGKFVLIVEGFVAANNDDLDLSKEWVAVVGDKDVQLEFNEAKGSTPVRLDIDPSVLPAYQQGAYDAFSNDFLALSVVDHGEAAFVQSLYDAVIEFADSKNVDSVSSALSKAANS